MGNPIIQYKYVLGGDTKVGDSRRGHDDRIYSGEVVSVGGSSFIVGIVADGESEAGGRCAQHTVDVVLETIRMASHDSVPDIIDQAIRLANQAVFDDNQKNISKGFATLVVAVVYKDRCFIGNAGDSRAYLIQSDEKVKILQLTRDHNRLNLVGDVDANSDDAQVLMNAVGGKLNMYVDLGLYLKEDIDPEEALLLGKKGLPLKAGDSIVLCTDGLVKLSKDGERFASYAEIVNAVQTEYQPNTAAVKMVSAALGRRPDDNVSAVTIQYLSDNMLSSLKSASGVGKLGRIFVRAGSIVFAVGALIAIIMLGGRAAKDPEVITENITYTQIPTATATQPIDPGKARVDYIVGASTFILNQEINPGTAVTDKNEGIRVVVGGQDNSAGVMFWFAGSSGIVDFDAFKMQPELDNGALYVQPGRGKAVVSFTNWPDFSASVEGSRMIVELTEEGIWIYCFEGDCTFDPGMGKDLFKIQPDSKRLYRVSPNAVENPALMTYKEKWDWNVKCNYCMYDWNGLPTPTPTPHLLQGNPQKEPDTSDSEDENYSGGGEAVNPPDEVNQPADPVTDPGTITDPGKGKGKGKP